ncbi:hypothetical protein GCM10010994_12310 [Chelatococcus reniformis]|uniref:Uncharacterized protein n=1 Tax=Chelatococcus reniformis TaxID=1494448 RepID=A0A916X9L5_9HYPH|nr:hypothetical protein GCM10010994_12310 [Chelatococcus reniformis]
MTFAGHSCRSTHGAALRSATREACINEGDALRAHLFGLAFAAVLIIGLTGVVALALRAFV